MKTSKTRFSEWGFRDALSQNDLDNLKNAITSANNLAVKVKDVPARSDGNHWTANEKLKKLSEELKNLFQAEIIDKKNLKDLISPTSPTALYYAGYKIVSGRQIAPMLMLAKVERAYGIDVILHFTHGSHEAYRRFNPLDSRLLSDGSGSRFIDATGIANINNVDCWEKYTLLESVADVVLHTHYLTEKNGYYHLSLTAKAFGLSNVIRLLALKIFADHLHYYRPSQWYSRFHSGTSFAETGKECAFAGIPERLLALTDIPAGVHRKMEQLIDHSLVSALHNAVAKQGGIRRRPTAQNPGECYRRR